MNIVQVLKTVISAGKDNGSGKGEDGSFWEGAMDMLLANTVDLCLLAYGRVTVQDLYEIAQSAPKRTAVGQMTQQQIDKEKNSAFRKAFNIAMDKVEAQVNEWKERSTKEELDRFGSSEEFTKAASDQLPDVRLMGYINNFFTDSYRNIADKTRSIIDFNLIGFLYNLLRDPVYSLFCRYHSSFTPEDSLNGKIILINLPVKDYQKIGRDAQIMFKYIWQRAMERRRIQENGRPVFLWADEAQNFLHEHDAEYQATARSSCIATVYISQNLPNYYASMGGKSGEYRVKSFLGTLGTKIFHANADVDTNEYASRLVGDAFFKKNSYSNSFGKEFSASKSFSYELQNIMRPEEFVGLKTGGPDNARLVEGVVHSQGKKLRKEANFKVAHFNQEYSL